MTFLNTIQYHIHQQLPDADFFFVTNLMGTDPVRAGGSRMGKIRT